MHDFPVSNNYSRYFGGQKNSHSMINKRRVVSVDGTQRAFIVSNNYGRCSHVSIDVKSSSRSTFFSRFFLALNNNIEGKEN